MSFDAKKYAEQLEAAILDHGHEGLRYLQEQEDRERIAISLCSVVRPCNIEQCPECSYNPYEGLEAELEKGDNQHWFHQEDYDTPDMGSCGRDCGGSQCHGCVVKS